jgi:hypothetical protein
MLSLDSICSSMRSLFIPEIRKFYLTFLILAITCGQVFQTDNSECLFTFSKSLSIDVLFWLDQTKTDTAFAMLYDMYAHQRKAVVQITTGSQALDELLGGKSLGAVYARRLFSFCTIWSTHWLELMDFSLLSALHWQECCLILFMAPFLQYWNPIQNTVLLIDMLCCGFFYHDQVE